jgi:8-oxo-dGTP pyrophosphatase MutT (NUDIX family)
VPDDEEMAVAERSAGIILYHAPTRDEQQFLLLDYGKYWDYPKGHVEAGEDDLTAASRELREETGIDVNSGIEVADDFRREIVYYFRSKRGLVRKRVVFFLARAAQQPAVALSHEHVDYAWLPYDLALERLTYASAKEVLRSAKAFLDAAPAP